MVRSTAAPSCLPLHACSIRCLSPSRRSAALAGGPTPSAAGPSGRRSAGAGPGPRAGGAPDSRSRTAPARSPTAAASRIDRLGVDLAQVPRRRGRRGTGRSPRRRVAAGRARRGLDGVEQADGPRRAAAGPARRAGRRRRRGVTRPPQRRVGPETDPQLAVPQRGAGRPRTGAARWAAARPPAQPATSTSSSSPRRASSTSRAPGARQGEHEHEGVAVALDPRRRRARPPRPGSRSGRRRDRRAARRRTPARAPGRRPARGQVGRARRRPPGALGAGHGQGGNARGGVRQHLAAGRPARAARQPASPGGTSRLTTTPSTARPISASAVARARAWAAARASRSRPAGPRSAAPRAASRTAASSPCSRSAASTTPRPGYGAARRGPRRGPSPTACAAPREHPLEQPGRGPPGRASEREGRVERPGVGDDEVPAGERGVADREQRDDVGHAWRRRGTPRGSSGSVPSAAERRPQRRLEPGPRPRRDRAGVRLQQREPGSTSTGSAPATAGRPRPAGRPGRRPGRAAGAARAAGSWSRRGRRAGRSRRRRCVVPAPPVPVSRSRRKALPLGPLLELLQRRVDDRLLRLPAEHAEHRHLELDAQQVGDVGAARRAASR